MAHSRRPAAAPSRTRRLTIVAQDPGVRDRGRILTAAVSVPAEALARGPCGARVHVIDYDSSTRTLYKPLAYEPQKAGRYKDPFANASDRTILTNPQFHAQNVYTIVMRTLARFEFALGRRVSWDIRGHQLKIAPHAFADANAFYSERDEALMFGYFPGRQGTVFSCLSHDVIAHETTHALVDGLRARFTDPSSPDQAGFHEGFSDVIALLSVFSLREVVETLLDRALGESAPGREAPPGLVPVSKVTPEALRDSALLGLAEEMGQEMTSVRGNALRESVKLPPSKKYYRDTEGEFWEPHRRGEILVAAMLNAFVKVWSSRIESRLGPVRPGFLDRASVAEEGCEAADYLLTMSIRALDYTPPVHLGYPDFLSAILTADQQIRPDDSKYGFRKSLRESFRSYGIEPASAGVSEPGLWRGPNVTPTRGGTHFESMTRDRDEVFRFVWENRRALGLFEGAYTRVLTVRPCLRIAPDDGFPLRETVAECMQQITVRASELKGLGIRKPDGMPDDLEVPLEGGLTLIFDEYGELKYAVSNQLIDPKRPKVQVRQSDRLQHLWDYGRFRRGASQARRFSTMHLRRALGEVRRRGEEW